MPLVQSYGIRTCGHGTRVVLTAAVEQLAQLKTKTMSGDDVHEEIVGVDGLHEGPGGQEAVVRGAVARVGDPQIDDAEDAVWTSQQDVDEGRAEQDDRGHAEVDRGRAEHSECLGGVAGRASSLTHDQDVDDENGQRDDDEQDDAVQADRELHGRHVPVSQDESGALCSQRRCRQTNYDPCRPVMCTDRLCLHVHS